MERGWGPARDQRMIAALGLAAAVTALGGRLPFEPTAATILWLNADAATAPPTCALAERLWTCVSEGRPTGIVLVTDGGHLAFAAVVAGELRAAMRPIEAGRLVQLVTPPGGELGVRFSRWTLAPHTSRPQARRNTVVGVPGLVVTALGQGLFWIAGPRPTSDGWLEVALPAMARVRVADEAWLMGPPDVPFYVQPEAARTLEGHVLSAGAERVNGAEVTLYEAVQPEPRAD